MKIFGGFCNDSFWDEALLLNGTWPQFTDCFQNTALVWIPCGFLWLCAPFYTWYLATCPNKDSTNTYTTKFIVKLTLAVLLISVYIIDLFHTFSDSSHHDDSKIMANAFLAVSLVLALCFIVAERKKGFVTSGVLFIFWILLLSCNIVPFYKNIEQEIHRFRSRTYKGSIFGFSTFYLKFGLILAKLIVHCFAEKVEGPARNDNKAPNPEARASFLSRLTFSWMTPMIISGYKKPLTESSMPDLHTRDKSATVVPSFLHVWYRAVWRSKLKHQHVYVDESSSSSSESSPLLQNSATTTSPNHSPRYTEEAGNSSTSSSTTKKKKERKGPSLLWNLVKYFWHKLLFSQIWKLFYDFLLLTNPLILGELVGFIKDPNQSDWKGYVFALAIFASSALQSFFFQQAMHYSISLGLQLRACLVSTILRKSLTISSGSLKESTTGEIINLMSVDVYNIGELMKFFFAFWSSPLQIGVALYLLYYQVGLAMFAGAAFMFLLVPINAIITAKLGKLQDQLLAFKDQRMKTMNELLSGIKIIKLFAWETSFEEKVSAIRNKELGILIKFAVLETAFNFSWAVAPYMVSLLTFLTYVYTNSDHYLDPKVAFTAIALFDIMKFAINFIPYVMTEGTKAVVSARRIQRYLYNDDLDENSVNKIDGGPGDAIVIDNGTFRWSSAGKLQDTLRNINVSIPDGELVAVVGSVGSGKSSLLSAMLGEIEKVDGSVTIKGSVSYVPQQAWIQNDTLRNNILFGKEFQPDLYNKCIDACALRPDLKVLMDGDFTEIGEKGINLSGGQKQRVSLARAVYSQSDIYLLDDPLSAVDSHVGKHIFNNILSDSGMLGGKVRVLVTHGLHWLPHTDHIIVMKDGQVSESGHYTKLLSHKGAFANLVTTFLTQEDEDDTNDNKDDEYQELKRMAIRTLSEAGTTDDDGGSDKEGPVAVLRQLSHTLEKSYERSLEKKQREEDSRRLVESVKKAPTTKTDGTLIEEESVETGTVKWSVVKAYGKSVGGGYLLVFTVLYALYSALDMGSNLWLTQWTDDASLGNFTRLPRDSGERMDRNDYYITIYGILGVGKTFGVLVSGIICNLRAVHAARMLHYNMLTRILHAPMAFFDTTPIGRIVNRFSKDQFDVDEKLPMTFQSWLAGVLVVMSGLLVISYSIPVFIAFILPLGLLYFFAQRFYIATSRQLKRMGSKAKSPIFNHFSETLTGAPIIRAFGAQSRFVDESEKRVDAFLVFTYYTWACNRWLGLRLELVGSLIILIASFIAVLTRESVPPGIMGLLIVYAIQITSELNWMVRMTSELETQIVSVERIHEYSQVDIEAPWRVPNVQHALDWPEHGLIEFDQLSLRYRPDLDLVLKEVSFRVKGGEKVGIVGRTGAGKSSLTLALFRLIEPASGRILIDGVDITTLGLHDLRTKITILPQDPIIFSGSLRQNLDPFDEYDTEAVWTAVRHCHLATFVEALPDKLDYECGEGGETLSYGQRQLLCLGRALLRKSKILILDEATAAVDMETDELLQKTIREEFKDCTVLTIAHRLNTVMDYDRILVLEQGEVDDLDSPENLLKKTDGLFYSMAKTANLVV